MVKEKQQYKVIAFYDGRPGHEKQTRGIVMELQKLIDVELTEIGIRRKNLLGELVELADLFFSRRNAKDNLYPAADLLIGTGTRTHVPMLKAKKITGARVVTCMSPASYLRPFFDLCFVPFHDGLAARANIILTVGPPNCAAMSGEKDPGCGLILVGGVDSKSHHWNSAAIEEYVRTIAEREPTICWTVASSPRTPKETVQGMAAVADKLGNVVFCRFEDTGPGWIEEQYAKNLKVWVTADSMSMVYEALSAGCRVGLLPVSWTAGKSKFRRSEEYLIKNGLVVSFSAWLLGEGEWLKNVPLNEAKHCAEEIVKKWLPKKN
jgi:mitochondrial fission protein ELM1